MDFPLEEGNTRPATELYLVTRTRNATRTNLYKLRGTLSLSLSLPPLPAAPPPPPSTPTGPHPISRNYRKLSKSRIEFLRFQVGRKFSVIDVCCLYTSRNIVNFRNLFETLENTNYREKVFDIYWILFEGIFDSKSVELSNSETLNFEENSFEYYEFFRVTCSRLIFFFFSLMWSDCVNVNS